MPAGKGDDCMKKVMHEWKTGTLNSGKKGPVVKSQKQAVAVGMSLCYSDCECGGKCEKCKKKKDLTAMGFSEESINEVLQSLSERYNKKQD
jgi:hypothetical protein